MVTAEGLLAMMGWQMLNNDESTKVVSDEDAHHAVKTVEANIFYPFTFPLTVGLGGLAIAITFGARLGHA